MSEARPTICLLGLEEPLERVVTRQLAHEGYQIVHVELPWAMPLVEPAPAVVVVDLDALEPEDGSDGLAWLDRARWQAPILLLTADRIPPRRRRLLQGAAILRKPFTMEQLLTQLSDCRTAACGACR